ncbi:MAG: helix-turn-helix domain-containing protein [Clostridia bacterium]
MNAARRLLKGEERISDIAYGVGYEQPNYFSRCFKEIFGLSPQEYRRRSRLL